jgi:hypothetical protein
LGVKGDKFKKVELIQVRNDVQSYEGKGIDHNVVCCDDVVTGGDKCVTMYIQGVRHSR